MSVELSWIDGAVWYGGPTRVYIESRGFVSAPTDCDDDDDDDPLDVSNRIRGISRKVYSVDTLSALPIGLALCVFFFFFVLTFWNNTRGKKWYHSVSFSRPRHSSVSMGRNILRS